MYRKAASSQVVTTLHYWSAVTAWSRSNPVCNLPETCVTVFCACLRLLLVNNVLSDQTGARLNFCTTTIEAARFSAAPTAVLARVCWPESLDACFTYAIASCRGARSAGYGMDL